MFLVIGLWSNSATPHAVSFHAPSHLASQRHTLLFFTCGCGTISHLKQTIISTVTTWPCVGDAASLKSSPPTVFWAGWARWGGDYGSNRSCVFHGAVLKRVFSRPVYHWVTSPVRDVAPFIGPVRLFQQLARFGNEPLYVSMCRQPK